MKVNDIKYDCKYFIGEKPCLHKRLCKDCPHYSAYNKKILIIKIGALGDVLRTTPILHSLKENYPNAQITWLTDLNAQPLLKNNPYIDRVLSNTFENTILLQAEEYDYIFNFEKIPYAVALTNLLKGKIKKGFGLSSWGTSCPLDSASDYAFELGLDNDLKFHKNKKTYQEILFDMCGYTYHGDEYILDVKKETNLTRTFGELQGSVIGLNTGSGGIFAGKGWTFNAWCLLVKKLTGQFNATCLLLGGPREEKLNGAIIKEVNSNQVINTGSGNSLDEFISIVDMCDLVVSGDTLGMHIAIGLKKKIVVLFGATCSQEIDVYGRGVKLQAPGVSCAPCYKSICDKNEICLQGISEDAVFNAIRALLPSLKKTK
ncbi:MAG: glycosyltransferase family 9 protein [Candidatus Ancaeobacter aquaticus]|nr:glycosyltransferase family 9 protein [Candidatus Ancaeobacter aquaticus]